MFIALKGTYFCILFPIDSAFGNPVESSYSKIMVGDRVLVKILAFEAFEEKHKIADRFEEDIL